MPMNPYQSFVNSIARSLREAQTAPLGGFPHPPPATPAPAPGAPTVLIFSPHPDDEVIIGGLALRLLRQSAWNAVNVAVTQGSNKPRQPERWKELNACCAHIGFGLVQTRDNGLEGINPKARAHHPDDWRRSTARIAEIIRERQPRAILFPHDRDWNSTHIGTHHLVVDALKHLGNSFATYTVETEFWGAMDDPNLMVELSETDLADLIAALSFHAGEVRRNPYHLRLPAWMIDNVRRGGELVGGQGCATPNFTFATLYRLRRWQNGQFQPVLAQGRFLPVSEPPAALFPAP
ncbi:MAG: PIG-L family deacetylase [Verrucomicrobia bacterium]|nr:PIG-L family deacetylase [Verrucomicrobiota bacterium]